MDHHYILRIISKMLIPPIMLYAFYVQFHGDFGPGGGFQAGVIFAVAFILYALVYGVEKLRKVLPPLIVRAGMALGVLLYAGTGAYSLFKGYNFLDYAALAEPGHAKAGQHLGILLVEAGVGLTVASVMIAIFLAFASRAPQIKDTDW
ncbi:MAG: Na(+)/H(+) antiporter subunit B [Alphaproteobacteria bacterium]|nr:cation:proton antiporter [Rhodobiaceae bacterium]MBO6542254.1 Na(+)/H(+) antiporter subunit B [Alphaproteobacteria bacterium]MBO6629107.1 Na(+)/H(+) antiporter subunit B [Alphaproteobacteria bacterium]MDF1624890.1 Na(+)/H(+) antiporter subunit B [Parvibaculaceae bacterium]|tara:strand:- start:132 stop:575 length:444 start_codon:yes stop_codon:yes gene_type:complete